METYKITHTASSSTCVLKCVHNHFNSTVKGCIYCPPARLNKVEGFLWTESHPCTLESIWGYDDKLMTALIIYSCSSKPSPSCLKIAVIVYRSDRLLVTHSTGKLQNVSAAEVWSAGSLWRGQHPTTPTPLNHAVNTAALYKEMTWAEETLSHRATSCVHHNSMGD